MPDAGEKNIDLPKYYIYREVLVRYSTHSYIDHLMDHQNSTDSQFPSVCTFVSRIHLVDRVQTFVETTKQLSVVGLNEIKFYLQFKKNKTNINQVIVQNKALLPFLI